MLDSLRGAAILLVVVYHAYGGDIDYRRWHGPTRYFLYLSRFGYTGVELFFVLSGFLITRILLESRQRPDFYSHFYKRRALRILPAYFAILVVIKIWLRVSWRFVLACLLYLANMSGILGARNSEYGPLWSLAVEEQFYLIWPVCVRKLRTESLFKLGLATCILLPCLRLAAAAISSSIDIRYKTYFIADYLAYGALIAIGIQLGRVHAKNILTLARGLIVVGFTMAAGTVYLTYQPANPRPIELVLKAMEVLPFAWVYCGLVLYAIYRYDCGARKSNKVFAFFGYISYGLYLIHEFLFYEYGKFAAHSTLAHVDRSFPVLTLRFIAVGSASVLLAYVSRRYYEAYFLRLGARNGKAAVSGSKAC
ncbi:MAG: acyltransferase family protein [Acidobacteriaceae bacterium]